MPVWCLHRAGWLRWRSYHHDENFKIGARGGNGSHGSRFKGAIDEGVLFDSYLNSVGVQVVYPAFCVGVDTPKLDSSALWRKTNTSSAHQQ